MNSTFLEDATPGGKMYIGGKINIQDFKGQIKVINTSDAIHFGKTY